MSCSPLRASSRLRAAVSHAVSCARNFSCALVTARSSRCDFFPRSGTMIRSLRPVRMCTRLREATGPGNHWKSQWQEEDPSALRRTGEESIERFRDGIGLALQRVLSSPIIFPSRTLRTTATERLLLSATPMTSRSFHGDQTQSALPSDVP